MSGIISKRSALFSKSCCCWSLRRENGGKRRVRKEQIHLFPRRGEEGHFPSLAALIVILKAAVTLPPYCLGNSVLGSVWQSPFILTLERLKHMGVELDLPQKNNLKKLLKVHFTENPVELRYSISEVLSPWNAVLEEDTRPCGSLLLPKGFA